MARKARRQRQQEQAKVEEVGESLSEPQQEQEVNMEEVPKYAKFLKDLMIKTRSLDDYETMALTEKCSARIQNKLPPNFKDPGSFSIPCIIGEVNFSNAFCDLTTSVSLLPLSIARRLGLKELKSTNITLQLADRSIRHPLRVIENVLMKVDRFIIPVDFVVLDMEDDKSLPIILGRPFLATAGAIIDVQNGKLKLRVGNEKVDFDLNYMMKHNSSTFDAYMIDAFDQNLPRMYVPGCIVQVRSKERRKDQYVLIDTSNLKGEEDSWENGPIK